MSVGQGLGAVVGGVIGFAVGGPAGAFQGAAIGSSVGGMLDPPKGPTVHGPRLSDLAVQTSTYGNFIPRVYGTIGIHGNLLWLKNNQLKETVRKKKQGGKGGGSSTTVKTYSYSATFILALCQGPIAGIRRIWCMDKLIYNAGSDDLETIIASNQAAAGWKLYLGTDDQMPDPRYEADVGVGNASAFRGIAYLAFYDFQLADYSNTLQAAQFKVEVVSSLESTQPHLNSVVQPQPTPAQAYTAGTPGGTSPDAHFACWVFGTPVQYTMSRAGQIKIINFPAGHSASDYAVSPLRSVDSTYQWWARLADSTEQMLALGSGGWTYYTSGYRLSGYSVIERSGHIWLLWSNDLNSPDPAPGGSLWCAKFTPTEGAIPSLSYSSRALVNMDGAYTATMDGRFVHLSMSEIQSSSSGTATVTTYDSNMDVVGSASFTVLPRAGDIQGTASAIYVDSQDTLHIVSQIYLDTGTTPDLYGKFYYITYDIGSMALVRQVELFAPNLDNSSYAPQMLRVEDGVLYVSGQVSVSNVLWLAEFAVSVVANEGVPLSQVVLTECLGSGLLGVGDVDTSALVDSIRGYRVNGGGIRSAIEPLQGAFPFDVIQSGYQIKCVPRGQSSVMTIPWEDLGAADSDEPSDILRQSREMDSQLPARTTIKYLDAVREYATSEQYAERINTEAINRTDRELPLVLTADEAAGVAEVLQGLAWLERADLSFTLPQTYLALEGADVATVTTPQATYQLRLTEINYTPDGRLECKAKPNRAALYTPNTTGGEGVAPIGTVPLAGESIFLALDIPVVDETLQDDVGFVGVMTGTTNSWPGGLLVRSNDGGQTWADLQGFTGKATLGTARDTLPSSSCTLIDQRSLTVDMISGEPESVTRDQMLAGVNYAAYGVDGRWEIVRFQNAALQADGSYLISGFVRGERGTEWATGLHVAGDYFVLLDDPDNAFIGSPVESIGLERLYRGVTSGASVDDSADVPFAYQGVNLECLSPVYAKGSRDGSSNFTGTFTRRSRLSSSWWTTGVEAPLGEATQSYEIDVMGGSTVARTISVSTPTFAYSAADQTTDFGSPQSSITFRIYQLSETVGRGYPMEVTL